MCKKNREELKINVNVYHVVLEDFKVSSDKFRLFLKSANLPESGVLGPLEVPGLSRNTESCVCTGCNHFHRVGRSQSYSVTLNHHNYRTQN